MEIFGRGELVVGHGAEEGVAELDDGGFGGDEAEVHAHGGIVNQSWCGLKRAKVLWWGGGRK